MTAENKLRIPQLALRIIDLLERGGAKDVLIVGGFVRDFLLGVASKDVDLEVYGLSYAQIRQILSPYFHIDLVGQAFGVIKVNNVVDVALPRRESKNGVGHKDFNVDSVTDLSPAEAFSRRDFTINAIGMRRDGSFCDPFDGLGDIKRRMLRATSQSFKDDPLRVLRGMQFAARFGFAMDSQTIEYCREVFSEFSSLSKERIYTEWTKWALKGVYPELGLETLIETDWINGFPELKALVGCVQNPTWHPEGDVWTHTKLVCKEMARTIQAFEPELTEDERLILMFAALGHDFGKPKTTKRDEQGVLRSLGHAEAGAPIIREFLEKMKAPKRIVDAVEPLVKWHMASQSGDEPPSQRAVRRLALKLAPANIKLWALLCRSDAYGVGVRPSSAEIDEEHSSRKIRFNAEMWLEQAELLNIMDAEPQPVVLGRDLLELGYVPGPELGRILNQLFEAQIDGAFSTREEGISYLQQTFFSRKNPS